MSLTQEIIDALEPRDPRSWRSEGLEPCELVGRHFQDPRTRRVDFVLHELAHLLTYPEGSPGSAYYFALAALSVGDGGLSQIVAEVVSKISGFARTQNERHAIELVALFWLLHDSKFPVERYVRACVIGQKHESEFHPSDMDAMVQTVRAQRDNPESSRMLRTGFDRLHDVIQAWTGDRPAAKGWSLSGS